MRHNYLQVNVANKVFLQSKPIRLVYYPLVEQRKEWTQEQEPYLLSCRITGCWKVQAYSPTLQRQTEHQLTPWGACHSPSFTCLLWNSWRGNQETPDKGSHPSKESPRQPPRTGILRQKLYLTEQLQHHPSVIYWGAFSLKNGVYFFSFSPPLLKCNWQMKV